MFYDELTHQKHVVQYTLRGRRVEQIRTRAKYENVAINMPKTFYIMKWNSVVIDMTLLSPIAT